MITGVKSEPRIVNRRPRRLCAVSDCSIRRENSRPPFFANRSVVAANDNRAVIIRAVAQAAPVFHVVEPKIIFLLRRNFNFNVHFGRIIFPVSKFHRVNIYINMLRRENFRDARRNHSVNGGILLSDAHNLRGIIRAYLH